MKAILSAWTLFILFGVVAPAFATTPVNDGYRPVNDGYRPINDGYRPSL
jgi:hypothetical protein